MDIPNLRRRMAGTGHIELFAEFHCDAVSEGGRGLKRFREKAGG
jgi:hypothetical protein